jgi:hypothetical protein
VRKTCEMTQQGFFRKEGGPALHGYNYRHATSRRPAGRARRL